MWIIETLLNVLWNGWYICGTVSFSRTGMIIVQLVLRVSFHFPYNGFAIFWFGRAAPSPFLSIASVRTTQWIFQMQWLSAVRWIVPSKVKMPFIGHSSSFCGWEQGWSESGRCSVQLMCCCIVLRNRGQRFRRTCLRFSWPYKMISN